MNYKYMLCFILSVINHSLYAMQALKNAQEAIAQRQQLEVMTPEQRIELQQQLILSQEAKTADIIKQLGVRQLIIIFDPHNEDKYEGPGCQDGKTGAMKATMFDALQGKIPIIASQWLGYYFNTCMELRASRARYWDIYKTKSGAQPMLVFIPKTEPAYSAKDLPEKKGDLSLGIKVSNLTPISLDAIEMPDDADTAADLTTYLKEILVTHSDIKNPNGQYLNQWDIYLTGHGSSPKPPSVSQSASPGFIAGMPSDSFETLLDFFNNRIHTRSLFYATCFSGGLNLKTPYQYSSADIDKDFNFLIITENMFASSVITLRESSSSFINFEVYFSNLNEYFTRTSPVTLSSVIASQHNKSSFQLFQKPAVRFPHTGSFTTADDGKKTDKHVLRITDNSIRRLLAAGKKEIRIAATRAEEIKTIILQSRYIPLPIIIEGDQVPRIIPFETNKDYFIKGIIAPDANMALYIGFGDLSGRARELLREIPTVGSIYIETLVIKVENKHCMPFKDSHLDVWKKPDVTDLQWGNEALTFNNVILHPPENTGLPAQSIYVEYQSKPFYFNFTPALRCWTSMPNNIANTAEEKLRPFDPTPIHALNEALKDWKPKS